MPALIDLVAAVPVGGWRALFLVGAAWNLGIAAWGLFSPIHIGRVVLGEPPKAPGMLIVGGLGVLRARPERGETTMRGTLTWVVVVVAMGLDPY